MVCRGGADHRTRAHRRRRDYRGRAKGDSTMCGLAGVLHTDGAEAEICSLRAMGEAIAHRGPDGAGQYTDGPLGLAHRRLAVLDLTDAGRQPMQTPDGRYVLAFVGEIYNFRDLRPGLEALGHRFRSRTDTEVLLYALAQWGVDAIGRLNGKFAFALWDCACR